jgi:predicted permease
VSAESIAFLANDRSMDDFLPTGTKPGDAHGELDNYVGDQYFATLRIPILAGRSFTAQDGVNSARVAVVNQALAKKYWSGQDPIGKTFTTSDMKGKQMPYTIVGVCANTRYDNLRNDPPPIYFLSYRQAPDVSWGMTFAVRTRTPRATITPSLRAAVSSVDRDLPLIEVRTQQEQIDEITASERVFANLTAGFGVLALGLACIGIYGIMAYTVSRRTNEIGIRMALGAGREHVLRMVLSEATWMAGIGIAAGLGGALALGRLVASQVFGLKASDPSTLLMSAALLTLVALGASWIPARRAASVDPMRALRHE